MHSLRTGKVSFQIIQKVQLIVRGVHVLQPEEMAKIEIWKSLTEL